jgi:hypothetical protein
MAIVLDFKEWVLNEGSQKYSCVMAVFDDNQPFVSWAKRHIPEKDVFPAEGFDEETHVTALYGLHTNDYKEVADHIRGFQPFEIRLGAVSKFDTHPEYDVIKIEVEGKKLFELNKLLRELPYTCKFDKYIPHCTLAYVYKGRCNNLVGNKHFAGRKVKVKELTFSSNVRKKTKIKLGS